ncbi:MAG: FMN-binding protein [Oscillospiraceae bacterium]|nr:FMN-binding protein [Oscillospiraceae bacterium]
MRKGMSIVLACAVVLAFAAGCGGGDVAYSDGEYTGKSRTDDDGAYGEATITIESGKIAGCEYVTWQKDGTAKGEDYGKVGGEISNQDYYDKAQLAVRAMGRYADDLVEVQSPDKVDAVSGATVSHRQFVEAAKNALKEASGG